MNSRRLVHRDDAQNLEAFWPPLRLTDDMRALGRGRISVAAQHRHVQENVGKVHVRNNETIALRNVEPLDPAADLDEIETGLLAMFLTALEIEIRRCRISAAHFSSPRR